jgi:hypothetical protein
MAEAFKAKTTRNAEIVAARAQGVSRAAIGRAYGISPERVSQILRRDARQKAEGPGPKTTFRQRARARINARALNA